MHIECFSCESNMLHSGNGFPDDEPERLLFFRDFFRKSIRKSKARPVRNGLLREGMVWVKNRSEHTGDVLILADLHQYNVTTTR